MYHFVLVVMNYTSYILLPDFVVVYIVAVSGIRYVPYTLYDIRNTISIRGI